MLNGHIGQALGVSASRLAFGRRDAEGGRDHRIGIDPEECQSVAAGEPGSGVDLPPGAVELRPAPHEVPRHEAPNPRDGGAWGAAPSGRIAAEEGGPDRLVVPGLESFGGAGPGALDDARVDDADRSLVGVHLDRERELRQGLDPPVAFGIVEVTGPRHEEVLSARPECSGDHRLVVSAHGVDPPALEPAERIARVRPAVHEVADREEPVVAGVEFDAPKRVPRGCGSTRARPRRRSRGLRGCARALRRGSGAWCRLDSHPVLLVEGEAGPATDAAEVLGPDMQLARWEVFERRHGAGQLPAFVAGSIRPVSPSTSRSPGGSGLLLFDGEQAAFRHV